MLILNTLKHKFISINLAQWWLFKLKGLNLGELLLSFNL